jgi:natural product precursor
MKNKLTKNKKFNLEKIEVAKLNNSQMKNIIGGLVLVTTTRDGVTATSRHQSTDYCKN